MRFKFHTTILICFFLVNVASANTLKKGTSYQSFIYIGSHINSKLSATDGTIYSGNPIIKHIRSAGPTAEVWDYEKVWIYCSHDPDNAIDYSTMNDYHVF